MSVPTAGTSRRSTGARPNGLPRCVQRRTTANSVGVSGWLIRAVQFRRRAISHADNNGGADSDCCNQRQRLIHHDFSGRRTSPAQSIPLAVPAHGQQVRRRLESENS